MVARDTTLLIYHYVLPEVFQRTKAESFIIYLFVIIFFVSSSFFYSLLHPLLVLLFSFCFSLLRDRVKRYEHASSFFGAPL